MSPGIRTGKKRSKSATSSIVELVVIIAIALGLAIGIQAYVVKVLIVGMPARMTSPISSITSNEVLPESSACSP